MSIDSSNGHSERSIVLKEAARYLIYAALVYSTAEFMNWNAGLVHSEAQFSEYSYVDYGQSFLLGVAGLSPFLLDVSPHHPANQHILR